MIGHKMEAGEAKPLRRLTERTQVHPPLTSCPLIMTVVIIQHFMSNSVNLGENVVQFAEFYRKFLISKNILYKNYRKN